MSIRRRAIRIANALEEAPRTENDLETAAILRQLVRVHEVAHEVVLIFLSVTRKLWVASRRCRLRTGALLT
jgi:hypothetical protein